MSEVYLVDQVRDLPSVQFRSAGAVYDPDPDPTALLVLPDNSTEALTLTKQGSTTTTRFLVEDFERDTAGMYEVRYITTDTDADIAEFVEYVTVNPASAGTVDANVVTWKGDTPADLTGDKVNSYDADANADLATLLSRTAGGVTYTAPVNPNTQSLALNQSQDYLAADGGQLPEWSSTAWTPFSLSTAASVTWYIRDFDGTLRSGAVNVVSDTELDVRTFANAVTALLTPGDDPKRKVQVWAVLDVAHGSAHKKLVDAKLTVSDDVRN